ncbi:MAG TPA: cyclic nucleotide-binding and patatin-like phospholipase domain-containing protein [Thermoanaerobaculia bacterium]|jgi:NTE family protein/lysophospholipid hydrolase|nr:cyclic nucleotide-binding and patatin-like phospholipase domain-containing protein [Thermoanaerobaculia bacterium]
MPAIPAPAPVEARAFLASVPLFRELSEADLDQIIPHLDWMLVPGGHVVCRQGDEGDRLYLVASGRLAIVRELPSGEDVLLSHVGRSESVGEVAVLTGNPRSATVRALRDSVIARLDRAGLSLLLEEHPRIALAFTRRLAGWISPVSKIAASRGCIAVAVAAAQESIPLSDLTRRLAESLSALGPTLHLTAAEIEGRFGPGSASSADGSAEHGRVAAWIDSQEASHAFLVYEADPGPTAWTRRSLRQADRILVLADSEADPSLGFLARELESFESRSREELVLLHDKPKKRPHGTARWLALRPFDRHHHIRPGLSADFDRLARFLDGKAVGLVLGGGGARGFAHIGVIRALEEAGIPIDRVGGTSMGAVIGALYSRGFDWKHMVRLNRWGWVKYQPHKLYTLPMISLVSSRKAERMLDMMFGDDLIEDLWLNFFCVSTNLTRAETVVHRRGDLERWIGTSIRLPGVVPPTVENGDLLVDGGVLDNLPTGVMRRLGEGPIIAVDVSAAVDVRADPSYRAAPSPWQLLLNRWRKTAPPFPNILQILHRSAVLASDIYAKQAKSEVELYLDLPMEAYDMFGVEALDEIVDLGYRYTQEQLAKNPWTPAISAKSSQVVVI